MQDDKYKYQQSGLKWLYEMELLDDPQLINNLKLNIMDASGFRVKEVEFVMAQSEQKMLVWIKLSWFYKRWGLNKTCNAIQERLVQLLPNFTFRIITDRSILELAITKLKGSLTGGTYAVSTTANSSDNDAGTNSSKESEVQETPSILPDSEERKESKDVDKPQESIPAVESDLQSGKKT